MNTNNTITTRTLTAALALSLSAIACGDAVSTSVEDGTVTETHALMTIDEAELVEVSVSYPEARLLAGNAPVLDIVVVPRTNKPVQGIDLSNGRIHPQAARPEHRRDVVEVDLSHVPTQTPPPEARIDVTVPRRPAPPPRMQYKAVPVGVRVKVMGPAAERYEALVIRPQGHEDDRVDPAVLNRL